MTEAVALGVAVAALVTVVWSVLRPRPEPPAPAEVVDHRQSLIDEHLRHRVVVTLKTGDAFDGVLFEADVECLLLRDATAIGYGPQSEHVTVQGEALIQRADVAYMQFP